MGLQQYFNNQVLAVTNAPLISSTSGDTNLNVFSPSMLMAKSGDTVKLIHKGSGREYDLTLTADLNESSTRVEFSSVIFDTMIPEGSIIIQSNLDKWESIFRKRINTHIHCYFTGSNNTNDYLPNFSQFNFNVNAGTILADGNSKPNRWTSQFGVFQIPDRGVTKIEKILYSFSTNGGTGHDFTFTLWEMPIDTNGSSNQAINLIDSQDFTSQNNQNYVFYREFDTETTLAQGGAIIFPSIRRRNSTTSTSKKFYGDVEIFMSYDPREK